MIYTLNGDITVAVTTDGGALTSIKHADGTEYLWQGDPAYWSGQAPSVACTATAQYCRTAKFVSFRATDWCAKCPLR